MFVWGSPISVPPTQRSLSAGVVPAAFKSAYIWRLLKKPDLDTADVKNYRPISNLSVLSKLLEKLVARQLIDYLSVNQLLPNRQSAYRAFRSTETAIAGLMSDILLTLDAGDIATLVLLYPLQHSMRWTTPSWSSVFELHLVWTTLSCFGLACIWTSIGPIIWYEDSVDNTVELNSIVFYWILIHWLPSARACGQ